MENLKFVQRLVGDITEEDLKCVEYYGSENLCICIPTVGYCKYAIKPNHTHPSYSFTIFSSLEDDFFYGDKIEVKKNHYVGGAISPYIPHEEIMRDSFTRYIAIFIDKDYFEKEYSLYNKSYIEVFNKKFIQVNKNIMIYIQEFIRESKNDIPNKNGVLNSIAKILVNKLIREIVEIKEEDKHLSHRFEINKAVEYMHGNFGVKIIDKKLAAISNMAESYFIHIFKQELGMTPMEYLNKLRIEKAKKLLDGGDNNITEVAEMCGYCSASYFSNCFNKEVGMTPSNYRKRINK